MIFKNNLTSLHPLILTVPFTYWKFFLTLTSLNIGIDLHLSALGMINPSCPDNYYLDVSFEYFIDDFHL